MGALLLKKTCLLFLIISASILSTSFAGGRQSRFVNNSEKELGATHKEEVYHDEALYEINERLLRVNTKDYGRYDPAPALVKPPFKLIPN